MAREPGIARDRQAAILHRTWNACILVKGIHSVFEIGCAAFVWLVKPETLGSWVRTVTKSELAEDPQDFVASWALQASGQYSFDVQHFVVFYLLIIGFTNMVLITLLWRRKLWSYPVMVGVLVLFIAYQAARWTRTHSMILILLSVFDLLMIWLTLKEYRRIKIMLIEQTDFPK
ncbi:MAG: DUF2127 domain-containing protein [Holophaga sp.]|jgi:uncharacterized membrane protein